MNDYAWLAFASAFFAILSVVIIRVGRAWLGVVGWHYSVALIATAAARDGFALSAVIVLAWHLIP